jgi:hypothetical protein
MFDYGTKIEVILSNCTKKTSPRVGSQGYTCNTLINEVVSDTRINTSILDIYFTRYGFEQKKRVEYKKVFALFPKTKIGADTKSIVKGVENFIKNFYNKEFKDLLDEKYRFIFRKGDISKIPLVVIRPYRGIDNENVLENDEKEFEAFCVSHLKSANFLKTFNRIKTKGYYRTLSKDNKSACLNNETLILLSSIMYDKNKLKGLLDNKEICRTVTKAIKNVDSIFKRKDLKNIYEVSNSGSIPFIFYKPIKFEAFSNACLGGNAKRQAEKEMTLIEDVITKKYKNVNL